MRTLSLLDGHVAIGASFGRRGRTQMLACGGLHEKCVFIAAGHGKTKFVAIGARTLMCKCFGSTHRMRCRLARRIVTMIGGENESLGGQMTSDTPDAQFTHRNGGLFCRIRFGRMA